MTSVRRRAPNVAAWRQPPPPFAVSEKQYYHGESAFRDLPLPSRCCVASRTWQHNDGNRNLQRCRNRILALENGHISVTAQFLNEVRATLHAQRGSLTMTAAAACLSEKSILPRRKCILQQTTAIARPRVSQTWQPPIATDGARLQQKLLLPRTKWPFQKTAAAACRWRRDVAHPTWQSFDRNACAVRLANRAITAVKRHIADRLWHCMLRRARRRKAVVAARIRIVLRVRVCKQHYFPDKSGYCRPAGPSHVPMLQRCAPNVAGL